MILIAIVHNNELIRLNYLRPKMQKVLTLLTENAIVMECCTSLEIAPTKLDFILRDLKMKMLRFRFDSFVQQTLNSEFRHSKFKKISQIFRSSQTNRSRYFAELDLVVKHIEAWEHFLNSSASHLVLLESDAIISDEKNLAEFLNNLCDISSEDFVSLSWPFTTSQLGIRDSSIEHRPNYFQVGILITNTTAGYVLSRNLAAKLVKVIQESRLERLLAIDWLMNQVFMQIQKQDGKNRNTIVPNRELVINGSLVGRYESAIQG